MVFAANCTWESGCSGNPKEHLTCCQQRGTGGRLWCLKGEQQSSVERWPALCRTGEKQAVMAEQAVEPGPFLTSLLLWHWNAVERRVLGFSCSGTESRGLSEAGDVSLAQAWKECFLSDIRRWEVSRIGCFQRSLLCDAPRELSVCSVLSLPSCMSCSCELYTSNEILLLFSGYPKKLLGPLDEYFCPKSYSHPSVWKGFGAGNTLQKHMKIRKMFCFLPTPSFLFIFCTTLLSCLFLLVFIVSFLVMDSQEKQALFFCVSAVDKAGDREGRHPQLCAWFSSWLSCHVEESIVFWIKSVLSH